MKPTRLLALLVMVGILAGMFSLIGFAMFGFQRGVSHIAESFDDFDGQPLTDQTTNLPGTYKSVGIGGPIDFTWKRSAQPSFTVKASAATLKRIKYKLENENLEIKLTGHGNTGKIELTLYGPQPLSLSMAGSGDCVLEGLQEADLKLSVAGSGDVRLAGALKNLVVSIAGSGDVDAEGASCKLANISIAGSGNAQVSPSNALKVSIAGSGDVTYSGSPSIEKSIVGSGEVSRRD